MVIYTRNRLVGSDRDDASDLYVARVEGGFPEAEPPAPECTGDACQGGSSPAPAGDPFGSVGLVGEGNQRSSRNRFSVTGLGVAARLALARRGRTVLRVRVPHAGRLVVSSNRSPAVVVRAEGASTKRVVLRLRRDARRVLADRGRLRLRVVVAFGDQRRTAVLNLRRSK